MHNRSPRQDLIALYQRYQQQAGWTEQIRASLLAQIPRQPGLRLLEVGCGPGVITSSLIGYTQNRFGIDLDYSALLLAKTVDPATRFCQGDAFALPYANASFDVCVCHFLLLWLTRPTTALAEMARVTQPGGAVIAFAEPDYAARIDYPPPLDALGRAQADALRRQGAEPDTGRALAASFRQAGLRRVQTGLLGGQWDGTFDQAAFDEEWRTLMLDLRGHVPDQQLAEWRALDLAAWQQGTRVLFVPTFYAIGWRGS